MSTEKRFYWLKLKEDFFSSRRIKKLRKLAGGDTYTIIYLKLQLAALRTDGVLQWTGLEDNIFEELALELDEDPDNVEVTLRYLLSCGLAETDNMESVFFPWVVKSTGSEQSSAERVRKHREAKALQCNATPLLCNTEKEIEKEKEPEIEKDVKRKRFTPPTLEEVTAYCRERGNIVDPVKFYDFYTADPDRAWIDSNGKPVRNWKQKVITWERKDEKKPSKPNKVTTAVNYKAPKPTSLDELRKKVAGIAEK